MHDDCAGVQGPARRRPRELRLPTSLRRSPSRPARPPAASGTRSDGLRRWLAADRRRWRSSARRRPVLLLRQLRQGASGRDSVGVVLAEDALADGEGALEEGAGGGRVALVAEQWGAETALVAEWPRVAPVP